MKIDINKLDQLREAKGWAKTNLSIQAGVSDFTLNAIRKGKDVRDATAQCIADALGVKVEDLLPEEEKQPEPEPEQDTAPELPDAITQTLEAVKDYGEHEYQRGRSEMCDLFLKAVREAIDRLTEVNEEEE